MSTTMNQDPYEAVTPDTNDNWINGPDAVTPNEALDAAAGTDGFVDPYTVAAPDGSDNWINGPDAVQENEALDGLGAGQQCVSVRLGAHAGGEIRGD